MLVHELLGQTVENLALEQREHQKTIDVLRQLKEGAITLERLTVDGNFWSVAAIAPPSPVAEASTEKTAAEN